MKKMIRVLRDACLTAPLVLSLSACERALPPAPEPAPAQAPASTSWVQSVRRLEGAPARLLATRFAPDGASLLVLERRPPADENAGEPSTYALSRRPIAGGPAADLVASTTTIVDFAPLGAGAVVIQRPQVPRLGPDAPAADAIQRVDEMYTAIYKDALYRIDGGGPPVRVSPEGRRCLNVIGTPGGQWVATSIAPEKRNFGDHYDAGIEIRVLGAKPGEETTLTVKGLARDLSPDGARVIVRRPPEAQRGAARPSLDEILKRQLPRDIVKEMVIVNVKDQTVTELPASLQVDGLAVDTAELVVAFLGDGLVFRSARGEIYRSALDGSGAARLAGPLPDAADAGAPADAGAGDQANTGDQADAGAPAERTRRVLGPKGTLLVLQEEGGMVTITSPGDEEPIAKLEGPLPGLDQVVLDAGEKRVALAVLSDTSRNGAFEAAHDDAVLFITDAAPGSLSFGRAPVAPLADEIRPKVAAAVGVPASAVAVVAEGGSVKATAELPWIDGEDAKALLERFLVAARALAGAIEQRDVELRLRAGQIDLAVRRPRDGSGRVHVELGGRGLWFSDREAMSLTLTNPVKTTFFTHSNVTLSGTLESSGAEPTAPIEVFTRAAIGYGPERTYREFTKPIGSIAPGKRATFNLVLTDPAYGMSPHARFRVDGKEIEVFNQYSHDHSFHWLETVLSVRASHGVWIEHAQRRDDYRDSLGPVIVHLTAEHAALPDAERDRLLRAIEKTLYEHHRRYHRDESLSTAFKKPGRGGWLLETGKKIQPFDGKDP